MKSGRLKIYKPVSEMFSYSYMYLILNTLKFKFVNEIFRSSFSYLNSNILLHSYKYLVKVLLKTVIGSSK